MNDKNTALVTKGIDEYFLSNNILGARNDADIIQSWLQRCASNSKHTYESYLKEIKRLCIYSDSIGKHYTEISSTDINHYLGTLKNPPQNWLKNPKSDIQLKTQLLYKPLSIESVEYSQRILKNFFGFLQDAGVLSSNPVNLSVKIKVDKSYNVSEKSLSFDAWDYLSTWLKHESERADQANRGRAIRDRWLMHLLYHSGARRSSIVDLKMNAFSIKDKGKYRTWVVKFKQKGNTAHEIIVSDELLSEWEYYKSALNMHKMSTEEAQGMPLVKALTKDANSLQTSTKSISLRGINYVIEQSLELAANDCEDYFISKELKRTTPHTFRHTIASHRVNLGGDIVSTQQHLGHKSINTTMIYAKESGEHQVEESIRLSELMQQRKNK